MNEIAIFGRTAENPNGSLATDDFANFRRPFENDGVGLDPTRLNYLTWACLFDYFNRNCFRGELPNNVLFTHQRTKNAVGYYSPERFTTPDRKKFACEIAINPDHALNPDTEKVLSTFVHELCHFYRNQFPRKKGKVPKDGYHDAEWVSIMEHVGLVPYAIGGPPGKQTGYRVSHTIKEDGLFRRACRELLDRGFEIPYGDALGRMDLAGDDALAAVLARAAARKKSKAASKTKLMCPACGQIARGVPTLNLICGRCYDATGQIVRFVAAGTGGSRALVT